jgi:hypothetical protein
MIGEDPNYVNALFGAAQGGAGALPSSGGAQFPEGMPRFPQITNEDIARALSPTVQRAPMQMPAAFTTPTPTPQPPKMDERQVVGKGNARAQGIGNAISATIGAVGQFAAAKKNMDQRQNATKVARLMQFQAQKDQAAQMMDQMKNTDPGYAAIKKSYDSANQQIGLMLSDNKFRNIVEKGFQISLTDPSENKTEHHAAVQAGINLFNKIRGKQQQQQVTQAQASQYAQKFQQQMPQQLGPNVQAQQALALKQAQQKMYSDFMKGYMNFRASIYRSDATVKSAQLREVGSSLMAAQRMTFQQQMQQQRFAQADQLVKTRFSNDVKLVGIRQQAALTEAQQVLQMKESDPLTQYNSVRKAASTYQKNMEDDIKTYQELQAQRTAIYYKPDGKTQLKASEITPELTQQVQALDSQIQMVHDAIQSDKDSVDSFTKTANQLHSIYGLKESPEGGVDGAAESSNQSDAAGTSDETPDITDPLFWTIQPNEE